MLPALMNHRPNIVLILADDTGYGDPPCYNPESLDPMPWVDRLAREGMRFTDAHSANALCSPSRYALLTGRYYWRTFKRHALVMPYEGPVIEPDRPTLPGVLRQAGYATACVGKWHLGFSYPSRVPGVEYTTDESEIDFTRALSGGPLDHGFDYFYGTAGCSTSDPPYCFIENRHTVGIPDRPSPPEFESLPGFYPGVMAHDWDEERVDVRHVEKAIEFVDSHLRSSPDVPFFLYLAISAPHNPWLPPDFVRGTSREGPRGDMNALVDWCVGRVYEELAARGILDDTLLIFTSDNGPMAGQNGHRSAGDLRGQKNTAFEGGHRVPFVARWPAAIAPATTRDTTFSLIDLFATLTGALDVALPKGAAPDSDRLSGLFDTQVERPQARDVLIADTGGFSAGVGDFSLRSGAWKLVRLADSSDALARRRQPVTDAVDGVLLFDLEEDPGERANRVREHPEIVRRLSELLSRATEGDRSG